jgi:hypothetical protein
MRTLTPLLGAAALALATSALALPATAQAPSLRRTPVEVECYQGGTKILAGEATNFEARSAVAEFLDFEMLDGRAVQVRQVGTAVCVILSKQPEAPKP